ncbi:hypothetical protein [Dysgonomonas sp. 511]|uniref:hypothetical protein n=1 Tax=Dysgonomonas sp. 511 TaxID=2302930 RepID=UPI001C868AD3|nr:hypothetical protein [Dysgonomonas sp. 511]
MMKTYTKLNRRKATAFTLLFSLILFVSPANAQTTIGSDSASEEGALLQLKETNNPTGRNSTRGLMLPRVPLVSLTAPGSDLRQTIEGGNSIPGDPWDLEEHTGLLIYNPRRTGCESMGTFVWMGDKWEGIGTTQVTSLPGSAREDTLALAQFLSDNPGLSAHWPANIYESGPLLECDIKPSGANWYTATEITRTRKNENSVYNIDAQQVIREVWTRDCSGMRLTGLKIIHKNIQNARALNNMKALQTLTLYYNPLEELDVSNLEELKKLNLRGCLNLKKLTLGYHPKLTDIDCSPLVSGSPGITDWGFASTNRNELDISRLGDYDNPMIRDSRTPLVGLFLADGKLATINLRGCVALTDLDLSQQTSLTQLDLSRNMLLKSLSVINSSAKKKGALSSLSLAYSHLLTEILLENNNIQELDLSSNNRLSTIKLDRNNLQDGGLRLPTEPCVKTLYLTNNPNLKSLKNYLIPHIATLRQMSLKGCAFSSSELVAMRDLFLAAGLCSVWQTGVQADSKPDCPITP